MVRRTPPCSCTARLPAFEAGERVFSVSCRGTRSCHQPNKYASPYWSSSFAGQTAGTSARALSGHGGAARYAWESDNGDPMGWKLEDVGTSYYITIREHRFWSR